MLNQIITSVYSLAENFSNLDIHINYSVFSVSMLVFYLVILIVGYVFRSVGVFVLSKNQGVSSPWLSFVPYLGYVQLGKLIGPAKIFGIRMKNFCWLTFAFLLADNLVTFLYDFLFCWKDFLYIVSQNKISSVTPDPVLWQYILSGISIVTSMGYIVTFVFTAILFFRYYSRGFVTLFSILSVFFEFLFGIFVFVCRNNDKKDLEKERFEYEQSMKRRNFYGYHDNSGYKYYDDTNDSSGKADNSPYSEYADTTKEDDVFEEYSIGKKQNNDEEDDLF